ncbi:hypothetical protein [Clostridium estertheticum]|uniref:hypothetical protein n=1 Tax=Clostridium estertheticum TaxID=238834 RepID=UPI001CF3E958|nr:hypothetical protein [Clostridium estertheticum]MCB2359980.1 hypothetical protein [Clostridium estertheticum]
MIFGSSLTFLLRIINKTNKNKKNKTKTTENDCIYKKNEVYFKKLDVTKCTT